MILLSIVVVLGLVSIQTVAQTLPDQTRLGYGYHDIDVTLDIDEISVYKIHLKMGDKFIVNLEVNMGGPVDFILMDNYTLYLMAEDGDLLNDEGELVFLQKGTSTDSYEISYDHSAKFDDTLYLILDNSDFTETGASPIGEVRITGSIDVRESVWTIQNIIITIVIVIVIIAIFVGIRLPPGKKNVDSRNVHQKNNVKKKNTKRDARR